MPTPPLTPPITNDSYPTTITTTHHTITADHFDPDLGPPDAPDPFDYLYSALASCVLITIRMYASRKGWSLERAELALTPTRDFPKPVESIALALTLQGDLTDDQRARIADIAGRCPVHRTLEHPLAITTTLSA